VVAFVGAEFIVGAPPKLSAGHNYFAFSFLHNHNQTVLAIIGNVPTFDTYQLQSMKQDRKLQFYAGKTGR
jgi:predicted membrane-bound spermidine synthase